MAKVGDDQAGAYRVINGNPDVSVILLLKNGERHLSKILDAIFSQQSTHDVEVIAIDSGSTDGTLEILSSYPVKLVQIPYDEFNHGETRNLGARQASESSRYIVYLTQDATPFDNGWLTNLINPLKEDAQVAGVFSRHVPRDSASPSLVRQLTTVWQSGGRSRILKQMPQNLLEYRKNLLHYVYFSNTSSAIRRTVWEEIQFRDIDFAEDADWADRVLRAGYRLIFEPSSTIIHSHDYAFTEQFRQTVDHTNAMIEIFDPEIYHDPWIWFKLLLNIPREVWRDWRFLFLSEFHKGTAVLQRIKWMINSPFWHLASALGGYVGSIVKHLPASWQLIVTRQERIKRGSQKP